MTHGGFWGSQLLQLRSEVQVITVPKTDWTMYYERLLQKPKMHLTPEDFLKDCVRYFQWAEDHPLLEDKAFNFQGDVIHDEVAKMRPFTKKGLAIFLGMPESRLRTYSKRGPAWAEAVEMVEDAIYTQKFEGAAAGLLNAGIITRDLGLADKQEVSADVQTVDNTVPEFPEEHRANLVHPDDPNPLNLPRPLYSRAQLDAGMSFVAPPHDTV